MKAHGQFVDYVFRSFSTKEHAEQFITGDIRFGHINVYKKIEDEERRDETEGEAHAVVNSHSKHSFFASNSIYILSTYRTVQRAREVISRPFIVKIDNPKRLAEDITEHLPKLPNNTFFGGVEGVIVEYTKGEVYQQSLTHIDLARLAYAQKPREPFSLDNEFRFIIICKESHGEYLTISIGRKLDYCYML